MPVSCDTNSLLASAQCYQQCIPDGMQAAVQTMLLQLIVGDTRTPSQLASDAKCFDSYIPKGEQLAVQNFLLCSLLAVL